MITVQRGTPTKLYLGDNEVSKNNNENWSYSSENEQITLETAYLATLSTATNTFTVKFSGDNDATFDVVVIDAEPVEVEGS